MSTRYSQAGWIQAENIYKIYYEQVPDEFRELIEEKYAQFRTLAPGGAAHPMADEPGKSDWRKHYDYLRNLGS